MKVLFLFITFMITSISVSAQETEIVEFFEVDPEYPGGPDAMQTFIKENIIYPELAKARKEKGTVYIQFVVNADGSISNVIVLTGVSELLDAEAVRVVKLMPNWAPAELEGKPVAVKYILPINFRL